MTGLRQKLVLGFGGLLLILLLVSALSITVLARYSGTMQRFLSENYSSVVYGQKMRQAIEQMDNIAEFALWGDPVRTQKDSDQWIRQFSENLKAENKTITLHGEAEAASKLTDLWQEYLKQYPQAFDAAMPETGRREFYRSTLLPLAQQVEDAAQQIIDMNLHNMVDVDGQVRTTATAAQRAMYVLIAAGAVLAIVYIGITGRSILQPLRAVIASAREIEQGNLDLVVQARSKDEIGQLAEAFNSMAAKLREFRRTDRARFERTQRTTQLAVDSLPDAIAIVNLEGDIELANQAAQRLFQLRPGTAIKVSRYTVLDTLYRQASQGLRPVHPHGYESAIQVFDEGGQEKFLLPHALPIVDGDKQLVGVTLVLADVTNLRKLDEMKSGMLSVVSHELKTPLTSIRMAVHLLLEERVGSLTPTQSELLLAAREDSDRLQKIIENLLDIGRMESGRVLMDLHPIPVEQVVSTAVAAVTAAYEDRGVRLIGDVPPETPPVLADQTRLGLVLSNLLTNALRYTAPGGQVRVWAEATEDGMVRLSVCDTGSGIPAQYMGRVFERFFRVPGQSGVSGAGLGLAIAKEIVEAHGGRISVISKEGIGSTFSFTLQHAPEIESEVQHGTDEHSNR